MLLVWASPVGCCDAADVVCRLVLDILDSPHCKPGAFVCFSFGTTVVFFSLFVSSETVTCSSYAPPACPGFGSFGLGGATDVGDCPGVDRRLSVLGLRLCRSFVLHSADDFQQPDSFSADLGH